MHRGEVLSILTKPIATRLLSLSVHLYLELQRGTCAPAIPVTLTSGVEFLQRSAFL